tara:strand:- start:306 stop:731 length:426 start_codon:yes stop_codon:yes gene_type:complete
MSEGINITDKVTSFPYEDHEHPSIRFDIKDDEDITKHLLFYKTDSKKSFSEGREPSDILFDMFKEVQTLPKIKNKNDKNDIETFNKFINFITPFIPHLVINSNADTNVVKVCETKKDVTVDNLNEAFKIASKGKRKAMIYK